MNKEFLLEFRKKIKIFARLTEDEYLDLLDNAKKKEIEAETVLFTEGKKNDSVYIIQSGTASVFVQGSKINTVTEGDILGEMSLVGLDKSSATVIAETPMTVYVFKKTHFDIFMNRYPELNNMIIGETINRNFQQREYIE